MTLAIERVGLVGCGQMGAGFAEVCARAGLNVLAVVGSEDSAERGRKRITTSLDRLVRKDKLAASERDAVLDRITFTTDHKALRDRQFVLEAVAEDLAVKQAVFAVLDEVVPDEGAVLASTTSALSITKLGRATEAPERVIGVHFFNPVPVMPLVELVPSLATGATTVVRTTAFVTGLLGKEVVTARDRAGFVVNAMLVPYLLSAVRLLESGVASAEDIDRGMTAGCGHPMGPLALIDLIGLDVVAAVGEAMYAETKDPLHAPPALLLRMIDGGFLGRKSGRGFHEH
ncbi:3-hydroxybutyryl-CoA dehydrogenase [Actinophytocola algeriensis]|uniref:3-hydroxybutyryl-CoA dehydrogenase n=1 Tax=Actinophytocola algeriensis TaxID=1768010 RepID=A0A7W7VIK6_9PSEU|nr:3-hydroxybutyryl-CoA dehydrogenase [Actinophytocola algeriensis]MBB4911548.1 3-hydroxybutyryl-CoA dehydrogenase [Actinophytocola algeriensis]MBE1473464.1 3-hydroxybutyryl-CoA dehydrogenase [Actinophytocola algeriensis]